MHSVCSADFQSAVSRASSLHKLLVAREARIEVRHVYTPFTHERPQKDKMVLRNEFAWSLIENIL